MMNEPRPFASLGPTLLARKGGARPAMRPQIASLSSMGGAQAAEAIAHDLEDLGWNDMGQEEGESFMPDVLSLTPPPAHPQAEADARFHDEIARAELALAETEADAEVEAEEPVVVLQQRKLVSSFADEQPAPRPARQPKGDSRRAAFTLRLDAERHLKLKLASTVKNRSAQQLVTQALDKFLSEIPEIEALAAQVKRD